jgi:redox-sensing transcriptional repressor
MPKDTVPDVVIQRLPLYLRSLSYIAEHGQSVVSSAELGDWVGVSSAQIRKDLSFFGEFGKQGTGYDVATCGSSCCASAGGPGLECGAGGGGRSGARPGQLSHLRALESARGGGVRQCHAKVGQPIGDLQVQPMQEMCERSAHAMPRSHPGHPGGKRQVVAEELATCGVRGISTMRHHPTMRPAFTWSISTRWPACRA